MHSFQNNRYAWSVNNLGLANDSLILFIFRIPQNVGRPRTLQLVDLPSYYLYRGRTCRAVEQSSNSIDMLEEPLRFNTMRPGVSLLPACKQYRCWRNLPYFSSFLGPLFHCVWVAFLGLSCCTTISKLILHKNTIHAEWSPFKTTPYVCMYVCGFLRRLYFPSEGPVNQAQRITIKSHPRE